MSQPLFTQRSIFTRKPLFTPALMFWLVYLPLFWLLEMQFFESKLVAAKISYFKMTNFWALDVLTIY